MQSRPLGPTGGLRCGGLRCGAWGSTVRRAALWPLPPCCCQARESRLTHGARQRASPRLTSSQPWLLGDYSLPPPTALSPSLSLSLSGPPSLLLSLYLSLYTLSLSCSLSLSLHSLSLSLWLSLSSSTLSNSLCLSLSLSLYFSLLTLCPALPNSLALIFSLLSHYLYLNSIYQTLAPLLLIRFHFLLVQRPCMW